VLITADCGGRNGVRVRLWKRALQGFADETGLSVTVAHLPPGTSGSVRNFVCVGRAVDPVQAMARVKRSPKRMAN
jgi:hypothetical protein